MTIMLNNVKRFNLEKWKDYHRNVLGWTEDSIAVYLEFNEQMVDRDGKSMSSLIRNGVICMEEWCV